ncbi:FtsX-like permease family protein [Sediminibacterium sp.]|uniref:FtsX-like permease family protein n=1 Tax=Sediminibacterium sp. TaxID=1917865 RepID=UPI0027366845|nr:FtsX-like permease family protein [Sediminibacterium sp.]MDP3393172.1 FtsX-like permease family protein [Sediminibacterium sp.]MDP3567774.1 FtsX-like permease family protein [Sediminibacterium sp.]
MNLLFAWRYFRSKKTTNAINIIAWIAITAIAVGTASLIIILSVFNGFEDLVKGLYGDFYPAYKVVPVKGKTFELSSVQASQLKGIKDIKAYSFVAEEKALLTGAYQTIVTIKGVENNYTQVNPIQQYIRRGSFELGNANIPGIVMGGGIENAAGINTEKVFEAATLYFPNRSGNLLTGDGLNSFSVIPSGAFIVQQEFDNKYAFTNLAFVQYMLGLKPNEYSAIEINAKENNSNLVKQLQTVLGNQVQIQTRYQQNAALYSVMQLEKWVIYGILSLILVVAAFNMIGALSMLVLEKQKDIAVLRALGASSNRIRNIFLLEGLLLATIGAGAGIVLGGGICWVQEQFHLIKLGGSTFIIDYYPVKTLPLDFILVLLTVTAISFTAAWVTAQKTSAQPFELRT